MCMALMLSCAYCSCKAEKERWDIELFLEPWARGSLKTVMLDRGSFYSEL